MNIFRQPFPHNTSRHNGLKTAAGFGIFVTVFLLLFRPFDLDQVKTSELATGSIIFGLVTFSCIFLSNFLLNIFFPGIFSEEKWTTGKQIINMGAIVIIVGLVNYLVAPLVFDISFTWKNVLRFQGIAISVGILPIIIYTLYIQNHWLQQFKKEAATLQQRLEEKKRDEQPIAKTSSSSAENIIQFEGENQKEKITVDSNSLIYIEAASNYTKIYFEQKGKLSYTIVRMTLKKAAETVDPFSVFFRCHRAFVINLDKIEQVEGNAQGYKIKMLGAADLIPVSRNLNREFSDRLLAFRKESDPVK